MFRSNLTIAALVLTIGCRAIPEAKTDDVGRNLEDSAQTDTADTGALDTDTASTEDTAVEDSGNTTTPNCEFEFVVPGNGRATLGNELQLSLSAASPSGESIPGYQEALRFNVTSLHSECEDLVLDYIRVSVFRTDNAGTEWLVGGERAIDVYDLSADLTIPAMTGIIGMYDDGHGIASPQGGLVIPAGETRTVAVYMDTTGISQDMDDALQLETNNPFHIAGMDSMTWVYVGEDVTGGTLVY